MPGQVYQTVQAFTSYDAEVGRFETLDLDKAQVITSMVAGESGNHKVILDIDLPAQLIPSTTPGHFHLYIDVEVPEPEYVNMLEAMAKAGVIEKGYYGASKERGFTAVRLPWVKKEAPVEHPGA